MIAQLSSKIQSRKNLYNNNIYLVRATAVENTKIKLETVYLLLNLKAIKNESSALYVTHF